MKINSAEIAFSAHHSLVQKHERRESLVEGVSQNGAWDPSQLSQKKTAVREERQVAAFAETTSLLDRRLAGRSQDEPHLATPLSSLLLHGLLLGPVRRFGPFGCGEILYDYSGLGNPIGQRGWVSRSGSVGVKGPLD